MKTAALAFTCLWTALVTIAQAACPVYTHKTDVILGSAANLPDGKMFYMIEGTPGLYTSPIRNFSQTTVPNTNTDILRSIDISDDGKWIVYVKFSSADYQAYPKKVFLIGVDGTFKTEVPIITMIDTVEGMVCPKPRVFNGDTIRDSLCVQVHSLPTIVGFLHQSPLGPEIYYYDYYWSGVYRIRAVSYRLVNNEVVFSNDRIIVDNDTTAKFVPYGLTQSTVVCRNHVFGLLFEMVLGQRSIRPGFITIPLNGTGIAHNENLFKWTNDQPGDLYGCGMTMSHDGEMCLANSGRVGSSCVPNKNQDPAMDHKGFYITKFLTQGVDPAMPINDQIDNPLYGRSINWCPATYRFGSYSEIDFGEWQFGNNSDYVIGALQGNLSPVWGLWIVQWKTNTWTLVTPQQKSKIYNEPALMFPDHIIKQVNGFKQTARTTGRGTIVSTLSIANGSVTIPAHAKKLTFYNSSGKRTHTVRVGEGVSSMKVPASQNGLVVIRFE